MKIDKKESNHLSETKIIKEAVVLSEKHFLTEQKVIQKPLYDFKLQDNIKSIRVKEFKFCNFLENGLDSREVNVVKNIFNLPNIKNHDISSNNNINFDNFEIIKLNSRIKKILEENNTSIEEDIYKVPYTNLITKTFNYSKTGEPVRIIYKKRIVSDSRTEIEIILIDLYHLFATKKHKHYHDFKGYGYCMSYLL